MRIDAQILKSLALTALVSATALHSAKAWEAEEVAARYKKLTDDQGKELVWSGTALQLFWRVHHSHCRPAALQRYMMNWS